MKLRVLSGVAICLLGQPCNGDGVATYTVSVLPDLGEPGGSATAVNEAGQVVGGSFTEFVSCPPFSCSLVHAVLWQDGKVIDLHDFPGADVSTSLGMNNHGHVVGQALIGGLGGPWGAWVWRGEEVMMLPSLTGRDTLAMDVNDQGLIAGFSYDSEDRHQAVLWQDGELVELGTYAGGSVSYAVGMNERGAVVGTATTVWDLTFTRRATLWEDGRMIMVDTRPVEVPQSIARAINVHREIVGMAWDPDLNGYQARLWTEDEATGEWHMTDLGSTTDGTWSVAWDINDHGQAVGQAECIGSCGRAFIWQDGVMHDLNDLIPPDSGWTLRRARAISNAGWIVGVGRAPDGPLRSFLLVPSDQACLADLDGDGTVGFTDLAALLAAWGPCEDCREDLDMSGDVGFSDLLTALDDWGPCP